MPLPLNEQVVVITGASSGMGRAMALRFAEKGAKVVLALSVRGDVELTRRRTGNAARRTTALHSGDV